MTLRQQCNATGKRNGTVNRNRIYKICGEGMREVVKCYDCCARKSQVLLCTQNL